MSDEITDLHSQAAELRTEMFGETVTIGDWEGPACVQGGPAPYDDVSGGVYKKMNYTLSVQKADLGDFVPLPQMPVTARDKELRIPDNGITEYLDRYVIKAVSRNTPE
jgi:hypothetical protein